MAFDAGIMESIYLQADRIGRWYEDVKQVSLISGATGDSLWDRVHDVPVGVLSVIMDGGAVTLNGAVDADEAELYVNRILGTELSKLDDDMILAPLALGFQISQWIKDHDRYIKQDVKTAITGSTLTNLGEYVRDVGFRLPVGINDIIFNNTNERLAYIGRTCYPGPYIEFAEIDLAPGGAVSETSSANAPLAGLLSSHTKFYWKVTAGTVTGNMYIKADLHVGGSNVPTHISVDDIGPITGAAGATGVITQGNIGVASITGAGDPNLVYDSAPLITGADAWGLFKEEIGGVLRYQMARLVDDTTIDQDFKHAYTASAVMDHLWRDIDTITTGASHAGTGQATVKIFSATDRWPPAY